MTKIGDLDLPYIVTYFNMDGCTTVFDQNQICLQPDLISMKIT